MFNSKTFCDQHGNHAEAMFALTCVFALLASIAIGSIFYQPHWLTECTLLVSIAFVMASVPVGMDGIRKRISTLLLDADQPVIKLPAVEGPLAPSLDVRPVERTLAIHAQVNERSRRNFRSSRLTLEIDRLRFLLRTE